MASELKAKVETAENAFQKWWGSGFKANEYSVPQYGQQDQAAAMLLRTKYHDTYKVNIKQHVAKDLPLSKYADKFDVGVTYTPTPHGNIGAVAFNTYKGAGNFAQAVLNVNNPSTSYTPAVSFAGAQKLHPLKEWHPSMIRFLAENIHLDGKSWSGTQQQGLVSVEWDHGSWVHGTKLHRKEKKNTFSLVNSFMVGHKGFAAGAELETAALLGKSKDDIRDYNFSAQYNRKDAFILTANTEQRLKKVSLSPVFYFGSKAQLAVGGTFTSPTASIFSKAPKFTAGLQYNLPARTTDTTVKTKYSTDNKMVSLSLENNDLAWVSVAGTVATSLDPGVRASPEGTKLGLSLVVGDNNKDTDHVSLMGFGAASGARCPYCK